MNINLKIQFIHISGLFFENKIEDFKGLRDMHAYIYDNKLISTWKFLVLDKDFKNRFSTVTHTHLLYEKKQKSFFAVFTIK